MNFSTSLYYDPTADINSFYAQQQSIAEAAAQRQAEILLQQYERSVAAQKEARPAEAENKKLRINPYTYYQSKFSIGDGDYDVTTYIKTHRLTIFLLL